ncbi:MAG: hypothetical protein JRI68_30080 [Deltaproteobacteria bacterium]|nr:hypothetical protein [Deltaproteobacteria bacterium]
MAKLVPIKCPTCGAAINVGPQPGLVTCEYCRNSFQVQRPGAPPPRPPPPPMMGQPMPAQPMPVVQLPKTGNPAAILVVASLVLSIGVAGAVMAGVSSSASMGSSSDRDSSDGKTRSGKSRKGSKRGKAKKAANPVKAGDLSKVEPADVIRQSVALAKKIEPRSKVTGGHFDELKGGVMDLKGVSKGFVTFEYRWSDPSKPAGKDVVEGSFYVNSAKGAFSEWAHHKNRGTASNLRDEKRAKAYPIPLPKCTVAQAWAVAVKSGVPADAISTVHWGKVRAFSADQRTQWSFRVEGHDEYRREIDAQTCKLLRNWGKKR